MTYSFRKETSVRTFKGYYSDYHQYKKYLAEDFHHRCGYTDCSDHWFGGCRTFQIDHFIPLSKNPAKKNDYKNLIYCCSYVNRSKWDDESPYYLDPCDNDYNEHFERNSDGYICGKTEHAKYMIDKLHLGLARYAIIWNLDRLEDRIDKLRMLEYKNPELKCLLKDLLLLYYDYVRSLRLNQ